MFFQRISSIFVALMFSVFLLAFPFGGYAAIVEFKYSLFLLICGGFCAMIMIILTRPLVAVTGIKPFGDARKHIEAMHPAMKLLFLLFTIVSAIFSQHPGTFLGAFRREGVLTIGIYVLSCFFLARYFRPQKWMIFLLGASTALFCILALVQLAGLNPFSLYPEGYNYYSIGMYHGEVFLGTLGNAGLGGGFVSLAAGVLVMVLIKCDFGKNGCSQSRFP